MLLTTILSEWLTSETTATWGLVIATCGLILATLFLYLDSRAHRKEQADRWRREDQLRAEAAKPQAVVELGKRESAPHVVALCYNLGVHPFVIDKLIVSVQNGTIRINDLLGPYVVLPGTYVPVTVDCTELFNRGASVSLTNIVFQLKGASGIVATEPIWFRLYHDPSVSYGWTPGGASDAQPGVIVQQPRMIAPDASQVTPS